MPRRDGWARERIARSTRSRTAWQSSPRWSASALVTWFDEDTPLARILECRPDRLVKGGDWAPEDIVGAPEVRGWGGTVHSIAFRHDRSTTRLLAKIRA